MVEDALKSKIFGEYIFHYCIENDNFKNKFQIYGISRNYIINAANANTLELSTLKLLLKPLSKLKPEEAIELAKIIIGESKEIFSFIVLNGYYKMGVSNIPEDVICVEVKQYCAHPKIKDYIHHLLVQIDTSGNDIIVGCFSDAGNKLKDDHPDNILFAYQYLKDQGYDLPHFLLKGLTLKEAGIATYEN